MTDAAVDTGLEGWLAERSDGRPAHTAVGGGMTLPTAADVLGTIDCGLLAHPYLEVYRDGAKLPAGEVFTARRVQNHKVTGFVHHRNVTGQYHAGATLRLPSIADWLVAARPAVELVRATRGGHIEATAYLAAAGSPVAYAEAAVDAVVLVCSGSVAWHGDRDSTPLEAPARTALYVPAGSTRGALAGEDGDCLLLVLAERLPTTTEFVKAMLQAGSTHLEQQETHRRHHLMPLEQKADWVLGELAGYFAAMDPADLLCLVTGRP